MNANASPATAHRATGLGRFIRPWALLAGLCGPLVLPGSSPAGEVALMPTRLHVSIPPGQDYTHVLQVTYGKDGPADTAPVRLVLTAEDWDQSIDGNMTFTRTDPTEESARPWLVLSPTEQEFVPGESGDVRVSIMVPEDAVPGEYRCALILQPRVPYRALREGEKRLDVRLRLSTVIYVEVPPVRAEADLVGLDVVAGEKGWVIHSTITNSGQAHLRLTDEYEVYDLSGLAPTDPNLDAPLVVRGDAAEAGIVLPAHDRYFDRPFEDFSLYPGTFRLVYRVDTGRELPLLVGEKVFEIPEPMPAVATDVAP